MQSAANQTRRSSPRHPTREWGSPFRAILRKSIVLWWLTWLTLSCYMRVRFKSVQVICLFYWLVHVRLQPCNVRSFRAASAIQFCNTNRLGHPNSNLSEPQSSLLAQTCACARGSAMKRETGTRSTQPACGSSSSRWRCYLYADRNASPFTALIHYSWRGVRALANLHRTMAHLPWLPAGLKYQDVLSHALAHPSVRARCCCGASGGDGSGRPPCARSRSTQKDPKHKKLQLRPKY
jgi:hypothetical protein